MADDRYVPEGCLPPQGRASALGRHQRSPGTKQCREQPPSAPQVHTHTLTRTCTPGNSARWSPSFPGGSRGSSAGKNARGKELGVPYFGAGPQPAVAEGGTPGNTSSLAASGVPISAGQTLRGSEPRATARVSQAASTHMVLGRNQQPAAGSLLTLQAGRPGDPAGCESSRQAGRSPLPGCLSAKQRLSSRAEHPPCAQKQEGWLTA